MVLVPGEECAAHHHERSIHQRMYRLGHKRQQIPRRRYPIRQPTHGHTSTPSPSIPNLLPSPQQPNNPITLKLLIQNLRNEVHIGHEGGLENHTDIRCVEQFYWVLLFVASVFFVG